MEAGVPAIIYGAGLPLRFEPEEIRAGVQGVRNVMIAGSACCRIQPRRPTPAARVFASSRWLRVPIGQGGVFYPEQGTGTTVSAQDVIGHIDEPFFRPAFHHPRPMRPAHRSAWQYRRSWFSAYALIHVARNN